MLAFPEKVVGRNLVFMIANIAVMYGRLNGYVKFDSSASEVLRTAQYKAAFLGITVHVKHVPRWRMSCRRKRVASMGEQPGLWLESPLAK